MAFFLAKPMDKVEYVYPFICGLCGFGTGNIDEFHHHFETHANQIPSSVFHLCEFDTRDDETSAEMNIGSFFCKTCNHTFPTMCNLAKHLDDDSNTGKYLMDLQTRSAYPLTSQGASVFSHTFVSAQNKKRKKVNQNKIGGKVGPRNNNISRKNTPRKRKAGVTKAREKSVKSGPNPYPMVKLLQEAQNQQNVAYDILSSMDNLDYSDNSSDSDGNTNKAKTMKHNEDEGSVYKISQVNWINCIHCGLSFRKNHKRQLKAHEEEHLTPEGNLEHTEESLYKCEQCACVMKTVNSHLHDCPVTQKFRNRRRSKTGRQEKLIDKTPTACRHCNKMIKKSNLRNHILHVHMVHQPIKCQICGQMKKNKYALKNHITNVHKGENKFRCEKCYKKFTSGDRLMLHMERHEDTYQFKCDLCLNNYKDSQSLETHKETIHSRGKERELYYCDMCPTKYGYRDGLSQHQRMVHSLTDSDNIKTPAVSGEAEENYNCDKCGKKFLFKSSLKEHLRTHLDYVATLPYPCDECPERYDSNDALAKHKKTKHCEAQVNVFQCDKCPRVYVNPKSLKAHQMQKHKPGDNWHACGMKSCRHRFKTAAELEAHCLTHKDGVEFCCDACDKTFVTMVELMQHTRSVHEERPVHTDHTYFGDGSDALLPTSSQNVQTESSRSDRYTIEEATIVEPSSDKDSPRACADVTSDINTRSVNAETERAIRSLDLNTKPVEETAKIGASSSDRYCQPTQGVIMDNIMEVGNKSETADSALHHMQQDLNKEPGELLTATRAKDLVEHQYAAHKIERTPESRQCKVCDKWFDSDNTLASHMKDQHRCFKCEKCPRFFNLQVTLKRHIKKEHVPLERIPESRQCKVCNKWFDSDNTLASHMNDQHRCFKCDKCPRFYTLQVNLKRHIKKEHEQQDVKEFRCEECPKVYPSNQSLQRHIRACHTPVDTRFPCTVGSCTRKFTTREQLEEHSKSHESNTAFRCTMCPKIFLKREGLKQHTDAAHSKTTSYM